jgi:diguanylate cyclase (GGDEF)-like protein
LTTVLVSLGTTVVTLVAAALTLALARRSGLWGGGPPPIDRERDERMQAIAGSIDLAEVLKRTVEAAAALPGVDAAMVVITAVEGQPIVEVKGMTAEEAEEHAVSTPPEGAPVRSLALAFDAPRKARGRIAAGLAVPIRSELEPLGVLSIFSRSSSQQISNHEAELEALTRRAGPAIDNALQFREARRLADLDALTGLHNRRYFHETLAREVSRAHRYDRHLALIVFDLDDFKAINDRIGHLAGDALLTEVAERMREVVRAADIACRVGGDEFSVILPESTLEDADQLYARLRRAIAARPALLAGRISVSAGMAEVKPDDDPTSFFQRADDALYRAKANGKGRAEGEQGSIEQAAP